MQLFFYKSPLALGIETMSMVPVVSILLGPVVGFGAVKATLAHFTIGVRNIAQLFVAGPPLVEQVRQFHYYYLIEFF